MKIILSFFIAEVCQFHLYFLIWLLLLWSYRVSTSFLLRYSTRLPDRQAGVFPIELVGKR